MGDNQEICLRWYNHQSTLVAVFDKLLENETLVDCTLAAEGKSLNAHKVVLSACSPFFESLLSKHYDKHPILILKDVKFQQLKAMVDFMYRGVLNIPQDQLGALLKAAESLQIKGLPRSEKVETLKNTTSIPSTASKSPPPLTPLPKVQGVSIEQRTRDSIREGSQSPRPRKKRRLRRKSDELDNHDQETVVQNIPYVSPVSTKRITDVPVKSMDTKPKTKLQEITEDPLQIPQIKEEVEYTDMMVETKSECFDEMNEDSIEDWTLHDDDDDDNDEDLSNMELVDDGALTTHGSGGEGSSQGIFQTAENECANLSLADKSKIKYMSVYDKFMEWRLKKNITSLSEDVLLAYFKELSSTFKPSSLWSMYSMLKSTLSAKHNIDLKTYTELLTFVKESNVGFQSKRSRVFTAYEVEKFLSDAPDLEYLVHKVALIFGINGACRREELCNLRMKDVTEYENSIILVKLPSPNPCIERSFTVTDVFYQIIKKYLLLRPTYVKTDRFFLNYQKGKCTNQPIGKNKIGAFPKIIAKYLGLTEPDLYTGHSFRQTSAKLLANVGTNLTTIKPHGPWDSNDGEKRCSTEDLRGLIKKKIQEKYTENSSDMLL